MNVIHLISDLDPIGGAQRLVVNLCRLKKSYQPYVLTIRVPEGELVDILHKSSIHTQMFRMGMCAGEIVLDNGEKLRPEDTIFHVHLFPALYFGAMIFKYQRIYTEHSTSNRRRNLSFVRPLEKIIYSRYDHVVGISPGVRRCLSEWLGEGVNVSIVENGIDLSRFNSIKNTSVRLPSAASGFIIGMVGRFSKQKDQGLLIKILPYLPGHVKVRLAGNGHNFAALRELANALDVSERVEFVGYCTDVPEFLSSIDLYIQSSVVEGFGLAAVEAMAAGIPVLATNIDGLSEIVGRDDSLFPSGDVNTAVALVKRYLNDPLYYSESVRYSLNRAKLFSLEKTLDSYESIYERLLTGKQR